MTTTAPDRQALGRVVGGALNILFHDEPCHPEFVPDPTPAARRYVEAAGWTIPDLVAEVDARVDPKTAWQLGVHLLLDEDGQ
jgi:hypothetical protein